MAKWMTFAAGIAALAGGSCSGIRAQPQKENGEIT